jgi:pSer/pThr/pTyr-binding forkhead associated (FHA) protein
MSATEREGPTRVLGHSSSEPTDASVRIADQPEPISRPTTAQETIVLGEAAVSFAWLAILKGPRAGRLFTLNPRGTAIGRDPQCDIILDDESVSRQHAKLKAKKGKHGKNQYFVWDLASANGTFVNGKQVVKQSLRDGDEVTVGRNTLVFKEV